jgi:peroxiredoxin
MTLLHPGDKFPDLTLTVPGGGTHQIPGSLGGGHFDVVLFFRGAWCPYCNAQLRAFQRAKDSLAEINTALVALSVDDEATTAELIARHGLQFPVGHSADARALAEATGAFLNDDPCTCSQPGSSSTPADGSSSASTPAAPSAAWFPRTSSASSATCVSTPPRSLPEYT